MRSTALGNGAKTKANHTKKILSTAPQLIVNSTQSKNNVLNLKHAQKIKIFVHMTGVNWIQKTEKLLSAKSHTAMM